MKKSFNTRIPLIVVVILMAWQSLIFAGRVKIHDIDTDHFPLLNLTVAIEDNGRALQSLDSSRLEIGIDESESLAYAAPAYIDKSTNPISIILDIDISGSMRGEPLQAVKQAIIEIIDDKGPKDQLALITFHDDIFIHTSFTDDGDYIKSQLDNLEAGGTKTALFKSLDASLDLKADNGGDRFIVVFSDGKDEVPGYSLESAVLKARRQGVPIYAVGFHSRAEARFLENMKYMARETGGEYATADSPESIQEAYSSVAGLILHRHRLGFDSGIKTGGGEHTVRVTYTGDDGSTFSDSQDFEAPDVETPNLAEMTSIGDSLAESGEGGWIESNFWFYLSLIAFLFAITAVIMKKKKKSKKAEETEEPEGGKYAPEVPVQEESFVESFEEEGKAEAEEIEDYPEKTVLEEEYPEEKSLGIEPEEPPRRRRRVTVISQGQTEAQNLLRVESLGVEHKLTGDKISIGRSKDNDLVIEEETVSRKHAELSRYNEGWLLNDLGSTNGTFYNGQRITSPILIHPGDKIRFGNVSAVVD